MISDLEITSPLGSSHHAILKLAFVCHSERQDLEIRVNHTKGACKDICMEGELKSICWLREFDKMPDDVQQQWDVIQNIMHLSRNISRAHVWASIKSHEMQKSFVC